MATREGALGERSIVRVSAAGETGADVFSAAHEAAESIPVETVGSTGVSGLSPLVLATHGGRTGFFPNCGAERARSIVEALENETLPDDAEVVEHDPDTVTLPTPQTGPLGVGSRNVLGRAGWVAPTSIGDYIASRDGELLTEYFMDESETVREYVTSSGLRGRGRGDASADTPVAEEWTTVREAAGEPVVVVNGNETDDHATGDRFLLESAPFTVLDPAFAVAHAVDATDVVIYIEAETVASERTEKAADALEAAIDSAVSIQIVTGPDEYKAGEPTMALEALEGNHRIEARRTPPGPSEHGLDGRPTLIHTPRTFAQVGHILAGDDPGGASSDPGTRLFTIAGDVTAPATVELSTDATLDTALPAVETQNGTKAACVGGVFGGLTRSLNVPASAPGLNGANLGTNGGIELIDDSTCMVALAGQRAKFARDENCGRCVPCREGSKQLVTLLRSVYDGEYKDGMLRELTRVMRDTSLCEFGHDASRPVATAMTEFETEFNAHANGRCPTGTCDHL